MSEFPTALRLSRLKSMFVLALVLASCAPAAPAAPPAATAPPATAAQPAAAPQPTQAPVATVTAASTAKPAAPVQPIAATAATQTTTKPAAETPVSGGTFVNMIAADPDSLNPNLSSSSDSVWAVGGVYSGLVQLNEKLEPLPDLADSWTISPDGLRYEFKLNQNARFHDGTPVTSDDVKYTVEDVSGKYQSLFLPAYQNMASIETPDPHTIVFTLKGPSAVLMQSLGVGQLNVLPKHLYDGSDPRQNPHNQNPIGSGPYKFKEWVKGDHITLVRNDDYFKGRPNLDEYVARIIPDPGARVAAFQKGDIDYIGAVYVPREAVPDLRKVPGVQINEHAGQSGNQLLMFNLQRKPLDDVRVRQAIASGIDQQAVVDKAYFGIAATPATSHLMADLPNFYDPDVKLPKYDVAKANLLLDEAGTTRGPDGTRFKLGIAFTSTLDADRRSAEVVKDNLRDVGIQVDLQPEETATIGKDVWTDANFDMVTVGLTSRGDPAIGISRLYHTLGIGVSFANGPRYSNPEVDQLFDLGDKSVDLDVRKQAYKQVQEILARDLPAFPLVDRGQIELARSDVGGIFQSPYLYYRFDLAFKKKT
jgi:peptide/nickel transport system substrate-binding protein